MNRIVRRQTNPDRCQTLLDHVHEFDSAQGGTGRAEVLEPQYGSDDPLDASVILFNQVVQILVLTDLDFVTGFFDERFNGDSIGSVLSMVIFSGRP